MTDSRRRGTRKALITLTAALALTAQGLAVPTVFAEEALSPATAPLDNNGLFDAAPPAPVARGAAGEKGLREPVEQPFFSEKTIRDVDAADRRCFRIPAIATAVDGSLLVAFDNRYSNGNKTWCRDAPFENRQINSPEKQTDIEVMRSGDNGESFGVETPIARGTEDSRSISYTDPSFVVDQVSGKIFAVFVRAMDYRFFDATAGVNRGSAEDPIQKRSVQDTVMVESNDNGRSWGNMKLLSELTETIEVRHKPGQKIAGRGRFATSGNGIQLKYGDNAGRLLFPMSVHYSPNGAGAVANVALYSDDHGVTWNVGKGVGGEGEMNGDENKLVELSDGRIMMNSKSMGSNPSNPKGAERWRSYSEDQGETWSKPEQVIVAPPQYPAQRNTGINVSLIRAYPSAPKDSAAAKVLLYSAPIDTRIKGDYGQDGRSNGWVMASCDDGQTWKYGKQVESGRFQYSVMTPMADGNIGMAYESGDDKRGMTLKFAKFNMAWLGADCLSNKALGITDLPDPALAKAIEEAKAATAKAEEATANVVRLTKELEDLEIDREELLEALDKAKAAAQKAITAAEEANAKVKAAEEATAKAEESAAKAEDEAKALAEQLAKVEEGLAKSQDQAKVLAEAKEAAEIAQKAAEEALRLEKEKNKTGKDTDNTENKGFWQGLLQVLPGLAPIFSFLASLWDGIQKLFGVKA